MNEPENKNAEAIRESKEIIAEAERDNDPTALSYALQELTHVYIIAKEFDLAMKCCQRMLAIAQQLGDEEFRIKANSYIARIYNGQGLADQALAIAEQAKVDAQRIGYSSGVGSAQLEIFSANMALGYIEIALHSVDDILASSQQIYDEHLEGAAREMQGEYDILPDKPKPKRKRL